MDRYKNVIKPLKLTEILGLLDGYDLLLLVAQEASPALKEFELKHLMRFNVTWELLNKHLYQSCVYTDPLVQNNLPVFISQVSCTSFSKIQDKKLDNLP